MFGLYYKCTPKSQTKLETQMRTQTKKLRTVMKSDEGKRDDQDDNRYDKGRWRRHRLFCFEIYRK